MREPCPVCARMHCAHQPDLPITLLKPAANLFEFREIQQFTKAVRKIWPGAKITLRPNSEFLCEQDAAPIGFIGNTMTDEDLSDEYGISEEN